MRFSISSAELKEQLQIINGAIGSNPVLPILEDVLFRVEKDGLTIAATDLETFMTAELSIQSTETGNVAIPAKILLDTLKQLPTQPLTFDVDLENFSVAITSAFGKYELAGEDGNDYPKLPVPEDLEKVEMPAALLIEGINKTLFATSSDDLRPAMTGVLFSLSKEGVTFVATDAHRLVKYSFTEIQCPVETSFIVPKKALNLLKNALANNGGNVKIEFSKSNAFFSYGDQKLVCRLIDARYPDYTAVIPTNNPNRMSITRTEMSNSLKRLSNFANKTTNQVRCNFRDGSIVIEAEDLDFSNKASEQLPCFYEGQEMTMGFNAKFLIEMLGVVGGENVSLSLSAPNRAGVLRPEEQPEGEDLLMLIMPLMLP